MFDSVECKRPLPVPDDMLELKGIVNLNERLYQTKDMENCLFKYTIEENGDLIGDEYLGGVKSRKKLDDFTGEIEFYDFITENDVFVDDKKVKLQNTYWITYRVVYFKGELKELKLLTFEGNCNKERKEQQRKFKLEMKRKELLWNKWYMKYFYKHYDDLVRFLFRKYRIFQQKLPSAFEVERFFRPL